MEQYKEYRKLHFGTLGHLACNKSGILHQSRKDEHVKYWLRQLDSHMDNKSPPDPINKTLVPNGRKILIFRKIIKVLEEHIED